MFLPKRRRFDALQVLWRGHNGEFDRSFGAKSLVGPLADRPEQFDGRYSIVSHQYLRERRWCRCRKKRPGIAHLADDSVTALSCDPSSDGVSVGSRYAVPSCERESSQRDF